MGLHERKQGIAIKGKREIFNFLLINIEAIFNKFSSVMLRLGTLQKLLTWM